MANDTTTTLNSGSGGDVMDESLVTQDSGTVAKRPRVVLGDDQGNLIGVSVPSGEGDPKLLVAMPSFEDFMTFHMHEMRTQTKILGIIARQLNADVDDIEDEGDL